MMLSGEPALAPSGEIEEAVTTSAAHADLQANEEREREIDRAAWQRMIDDYLIEWGRDRGQLEEDGIVPPSSEVIDRACNFALKCRDACLPAPLRVAPDGDGGIVFERRSGDVLKTLEILPDGLIEVKSFIDCRLRFVESIFFDT